MKSILNENEITQLDERNIEAKKHIEHNVVTIGSNKHVSNKVTYIKTRTQKYFCSDCRAIFDTYNTTENEKIKKDILKDVSEEE